MHDTEAQQSYFSKENSNMSKKKKDRKEKKEINFDFYNKVQMKS